MLSGLCRQTGCICERGGGVDFAASLLVCEFDAEVEDLHVCSRSTNLRPTPDYRLTLSSTDALCQQVHAWKQTERSGLFPRARHGVL